MIENTQQKKLYTRKQAEYMACEAMRHQVLITLNELEIWLKEGKNPTEYIQLKRSTFDPANN
jgi:hypothetical protein